MTRTWLASFIPLVAWWLPPGGTHLAHADTHTCAYVADDVIVVDGLHDDWRGIARFHTGGTERDASFTARCAYDDRRLHVAVDVRDDYLYRGAKPRRTTDDHLSIALGADGDARDQLLVYPGSDDASPRRTWNRRKLPGWIEVEDTQTRTGWSMEVSIPLARIRGFGPGTPAIAARIEYRDADFAAKVESKLQFTGRLELQVAAELYRSFLQASGLSAKDITIDRMVDIDDAPGTERVIAGAHIIGVLGDRFFFMALPVTSPGDVVRIDIADLRGDGTHSIITEVRQHGNGGSRDVVTVWQISGQRFIDVLAFESRKAMADKRLVNRWRLAPRGAYRAGAARSRSGHDLVIEVDDADAKGWDEDNYFETPAADVQPILTPWSDRTSAVYYFEGNTAQGGDPKVDTGRRRSRKR